MLRIGKVSISRDGNVGVRPLRSRLSLGKAYGVPSKWPLRADAWPIRWSKVEIGRSA